MSESTQAIMFIVSVVITLIVLKIIDSIGKTNTGNREIDEVLNIEPIEPVEKVTSIKEESEAYFKQQEERFSKTYKKYMDTIEWQTLRFDVYKRDNFRCKQCGKDLSKMNGNVHHTNYDNVYNESLDDLELVCVECHCLIHTYYKLLMPLNKRFNLLSDAQVREIKAKLEMN